MAPRFDRSRERRPGDHQRRTGHARADRRARRRAASCRFAATTSPSTRTRSSRAPSGTRGQRAPGHGPHLERRPEARPLRAASATCRATTCGGMHRRPGRAMRLRRRSAFQPFAARGRAPSRRSSSCSRSFSAISVALSIRETSRSRHRADGRGGRARQRTLAERYVREAYCSSAPERQPTPRSPRAPAPECRRAHRRRHGAGGQRRRRRDGARRRRPASRRRAAAAGAAARATISRRPGAPGSPAGRSIRCRSPRKEHIAVGDPGAAASRARRPDLERLAQRRRARSRRAPTATSAALIIDAGRPRRRGAAGGAAARAGPDRRDAAPDARTSAASSPPRPTSSSSSARAAASTPASRSSDMLGGREPGAARQRVRRVVHADDRDARRAQCTTAASRTRSSSALRNRFGEWRHVEAHVTDMRARAARPRRSSSTRATSASACGSRTSSPARRSRTA